MPLTAAPPTPALKTLRAPRFQQAATAINDWSASIEFGHSLTDILVPEYWGHFATQLRPFDKIRCCAEDGSFYAELLVRRTGRQMAIVEMLLSKDLTADTSKADAIEEAKNFDIGYVPAHKFRVVRRVDKEVVGKGFETEAEARTWLLTDYLKDRPKAAA